MQSRGAKLDISQPLRTWKKDDKATETYPSLKAQLQAKSWHSTCQGTATASVLLGETELQMCGADVGCDWPEELLPVASFCLVYAKDFLGTLSRHMSHPRKSDTMRLYLCSVCTRMALRPIRKRTRSKGGHPAVSSQRLHQVVASWTVNCLDEPEYGQIIEIYRLGS